MISFGTLAPVPSTIAPLANGGFPLCVGQHFIDSESDRGNYLHTLLLDGT